MTSHGLFIDGDETDGAAGATGIVDPATGATIAEVAAAGPADVDRAVSVARQRYEAGDWRDLPPRTRGAVLGRVAALIRERLEPLAQLESRNAGKPIVAARGELGALARTFEFYAGAVDKVGGHTLPTSAPGTLLTFREPLGVCAAIVPWNFPAVIAGWKLAPALTMGNSVVLKPAGVTPLSVLTLAGLLVEAGVPAGVVNVVPGAGSVVGDALVRHPNVAKVSFTGSTEVGRGVMAAAADDITRVSLELGGKSANIVFADTDVDACVESSIFSVYDNAGQDCCARSRILVERSIFATFVERFVSRAESLTIGLTASASTEMGPLITPQHRGSVEDWLQKAADDNATRLCGGDRPDGELRAGNYLTPAVLVDVTPEMPVMRDEVFGPVVGIMAFDDADEAVRLANDSVYGLSGSVWTRDLDRALRVVRRFETGMISVNSSSSVHIEAPFGGVKQSGLGREQGLVALDHYSEWKSVFIAHG